MRSYLRKTMRGLKIKFEAISFIFQISSHMHIFLMRTHTQQRNTLVSFVHTSDSQKEKAPGRHPLVVSGSMSTVRRGAKNMLVWFFGDIVGKILSLAFVMLRSIFMQKATAHSLLLSLSQACSASYQT